MTLLAGFMMAESALIGLRMGLVGSAMSMMTTSAVSPTFSRTQMNLSDSMVRVLKDIDAGLIPTLVSYKKEKYDKFCAILFFHIIIYYIISLLYKVFDYQFTVSLISHVCLY